MSRAVLDPDRAPLVAAEGDRARSPRPLRVLHLIPELDVGGAELMLARLVAAVDRSCVEPLVVSMTDVGPVGAAMREAGTTVVALGMGQAGVRIDRLLKLVPLLRRARPHLVQTWLYHADLAGLVAARCAGIQNVVWNIRCSEIDTREHSAAVAIARRVLPRLSSWPAAVIANSDAGRTAHAGLGYRPRRWVVIPNGIDTRRFRPSAAARAAFRREIGAADDVPLVGMVARLHPMKDHANFLSAAALVSARCPGARFVVAGRDVDTSPALRAQVAALQLENRVRLLGERSDAPDVLAALDVAVMPSRSEGFPTVVAEAMACATPCVATDVGDARTIIGDNGVVVPSHNPGALAEGIVRLLQMEPPALRALGSAARAAVAERYAIERIAEQYLRLWLELVSSPSDPGACAG